MKSKNVAPHWLLALVLLFSSYSVYAQRLSVPPPVSQEATPVEEVSSASSSTPPTRPRVELNDSNHLTVALPTASDPKYPTPSQALPVPPSLPELKNPAVAQLPFTVAYDSFAVPVRWSLRMIHPQASPMPPPINGDIASLLSRLPIEQVVPKEQIMMGATMVRLHGTFMLKDSKNLVKVKVEQITSTDITFTVGRDFTLYRYLLPSELMAAPAASH